MHEMSIAESILNIVEQELEKHNCTKLILVRVHYGALAQIVAHSLQFCFEAIIKDGPYAGARLELEEIPLLLRCGACAKDFNPQEGEVFSPCSYCQMSVGHEVLKGRELYVQNIEAE